MSNKSHMNYPPQSLVKPQKHFALKINYALICNMYLRAFVECRMNALSNTLVINISVWIFIRPFCNLVCYGIYCVCLVFDRKSDKFYCEQGSAGFFISWFMFFSYQLQG